MNFQDLKKIEKADFYLDVAFRKASKRISEIKSSVKSKDKLSKTKNLERTRIELITYSLTDNLKQILTSFPDIDNIDIFYQELIKCTLDYKSLKKSLGSVNWAIKKIEQFFRLYKDKIKQSYEFNAIKKQQRKFYGRVSSILKQINPYLAYLEESRRELKAYPAIKTSVYTVCILGFPNVGKSTLLSKLTTANPEIKSYPFTTKSLNLGYIKDPGYNVQIIDTPGTLNRMDKMNKIELQAYLALKYLTNLIVYVFDPTFEYELEKQEKLLDKMKEFEKPIILFLSKIDIADGTAIDQFKEKYPDAITNITELKEKIRAFSREKKELK